MSNTKTTALSGVKLKYEKTGKEGGFNREAVARYELKEKLNTLETHKILWYLAKRHKFEIVVFLMIIQALATYLNFIPRLIIGLIGG